VESGAAASNATATAKAKANRRRGVGRMGVQFDNARDAARRETGDERNGIADHFDLGRSFDVQVKSDGSVELRLHRRVIGGGGAWDLAKVKKGDLAFEILAGESAVEDGRRSIDQAIGPKSRPAQNEADGRRRLVQVNPRDNLVSGRSGCCAQAGSCGGLFVRGRSELGGFAGELFETTVAPGPGCQDIFGAEGPADALLGERRRIGCVVQEPSAMVVPQVMVRVVRAGADAGDFCFEVHGRSFRGDDRAAG
jgi:hypothetical protein